MKYTKSYWNWNNSQDDLLIKILNNKKKLDTKKKIKTIKRVNNN